jgi:hypothetical protein
MTHINFRVVYVNDLYSPREPVLFFSIRIVMEIALIFTKIFFASENQDSNEITEQL